MPEIPLGNVVGPQGPQGPKGDKGDKGDTGTFDPADLQRITNLENGKVDKVTGKGLSTNDYTDADKAAVETIGNKVDKVTGKALSTNDYTDADKNKLSGIEAQANKTTIDSTLSNTGQAADAKTTGDNFAALHDLISRMEIHCNASGNPATFSDAAVANVKALSVALTSTQSGSGTPYPPGGGKNKFEITADSATTNGITFTVDKSAGTVTVSGTASANTSLTLGTFVFDAEHSYTMTGCPTGGANNRYQLYIGGSFNGDWSQNSDLGEGVSPVSDGQTHNIIIVIRNGVTMNNAVYRPMIRLASDTDPTFAPYSNIRPISGVSSVTVTRTGQNGANSQSVTISLVDSSSNPLTVYGGTLDVTAGTLSVTWANIASYNGETLPGRWISDRDVYASGTTPTTGAQVVYELANPVTYTLTPRQLATLAGYNAVSSSAGNVAVIYKADTSLVWG